MTSRWGILPSYKCLLALVSPMALSGIIQFYLGTKIGHHVFRSTENSAMVSLLDVGPFVPTNRGRKDLSKLFFLFSFL